MSVPAASPVTVATGLAAGAGSSGFRAEQGADLAQPGGVLAGVVPQNRRSLPSGRRARTCAAARQRSQRSWRGEDRVGGEHVGRSAAHVSRAHGVRRGQANWSRGCLPPTTSTPPVPQRGLRRRAVARRDGVVTVAEGGAGVLIVDSLRSSSDCGTTKDPARNAWLPPRCPRVALLPAQPSRWGLPPNSLVRSAVRRGVPGGPPRPRAVPSRRAGPVRPAACRPPSGTGPGRTSSSSRRPPPASHARSARLWAATTAAPITAARRSPSGSPAKRSRSCRVNRRR